MRKRSVTIGGHQTSITLEDAFWTELSVLAEARGLSLNALVAEVDHARTAPGNSAYSSRAALTIWAKLRGSRLAPPTRAPSMSGWLMSLRAFSGFTLPPY